MFYLLHFDTDRHIGLIEENGAQWLAPPPYSKETMKEIKNNFKFENVISRSATIENVLNEVRCEAHIHALDTISNLWAKQASGSAISLSIDKSRNLLLKHFEAAQENNTLLNADFVDVHCTRLALGLSKSNLAKVEKNMHFMSEDDQKRLKYLLSHPYNDWQEDKDRILDYINRVLIPSKRYLEAKNTILAIKVHCKSLSPINIRDMDNYLSIIGKNLMSAAIEQGETLAKPWQKYAKTNAGFKYRTNQDKKESEEDIKNNDQEKIDQS